MQEESAVDKIAAFKTQALWHEHARLEKTLKENTTHYKAWENTRKHKNAK